MPICERYSSNALSAALAGTGSLLAIAGFAVGNDSGAASFVWNASLCLSESLKYALMSPKSAPSACGSYSLAAALCAHACSEYGSGAVAVGCTFGISPICVRYSSNALSASSAETGLANAAGSGGNLACGIVGSNV